MEQVFLAHDEVKRNSEALCSSWRGVQLCISYKKISITWKVHFNCNQDTKQGSLSIKDNIKQNHPQLKCLIALFRGIIKENDRIIGISRILFNIHAFNLLQNESESKKLMNNLFKTN